MLAALFSVSAAALGGLALTSAPQPFWQRLVADPPS
jgi:hypothetical protein